MLSANSKSTNLLRLPSNRLNTHRSTNTTNESAKRMEMLRNKFENSSSIKTANLRNNAINESK